MYISGCQQFMTRTTSCKKNNTKEKKVKERKITRRKKEGKKERQEQTRKGVKEGWGRAEGRKEGGKEGRKKIGKRYASNHKTDLPKRDGFALKGNLKRLFSQCSMFLPTVYMYFCTSVHNQSHMKSTYGKFSKSLFSKISPVL